MSNSFALTTFIMASSPGHGAEHFEADRQRTLC
jgi:hypothetical protein